MLDPSVGCKATRISFGGSPRAQPSCSMLHAVACTLLTSFEYDSSLTQLALLGHIILTCKVRSVRACGLIYLTLS